MESAEVGMARTDMSREDMEEIEEIDSGRLEQEEAMEEATEEVLEILEEEREEWAQACVQWTLRRRICHP